MRDARRAASVAVAHVTRQNASSRISRSLHQ
jgi:hypothetical protein